MAKKEYVQGTCVAVLDRDKNTGAPSSSIEMDTNGDRWHVEQGKDPVLLRDQEEVDAVYAAAK